MEFCIQDSTRIFMHMRHSRSYGHTGWKLRRILPGSRSCKIHSGSGCWMNFRCRRVEMTKALQLTCLPGKIALLLPMTGFISCIKGSCQWQTPLGCSVRWSHSIPLDLGNLEYLKPVTVVIFKLGHFCRCLHFLLKLRSPAHLLPGTANKQYSHHLLGFGLGFAGCFTSGVGLQLLRVYSIEHHWVDWFGLVDNSDAAILSCSTQYYSHSGSLQILGLHPSFR